MSTGAVDPLIQAIVDGVVARLKAQPDRITPRVLNLEQCATYLGRTPAAIRQLVIDGKIPVLKIDKRVQFDVRDLDRVIDQLERKVAS